MRSPHCGILSVFNVLIYVIPRCGGVPSVSVLQNPAFSNIASPVRRHARTMQKNLTVREWLSGQPGRSPPIPVRRIGGLQYEMLYIPDCTGNNLPNPRTGGRSRAGSALRLRSSATLSKCHSAFFIGIASKSIRWRCVWYFRRNILPHWRK